MQNGKPNMLVLVVVVLLPPLTAAMAESVPKTTGKGGSLLQARLGLAGMHE